MLAPVLEGLAEEKGDEYLMASVDAFEERELAVAHQISAVPTFLFIAGGKVVDTQRGMMSKDAIVEKLESLDQ